MQLPSSIQSIQRERRKKAFYGRRSELDDFQQNLVIAPEDRKFIWNIYGQGGIGKTSLLKQFLSLARERGGVASFVDESQPGVLEVLESLAEQFRQQGVPMSKFGRRLHKYKELKQQVEADPKLPNGFSSMLGKAVAKAGITVAKQIPGAALAFEFLGEESVVEKAGELSAYLSQRLANNDDIRLLLSPIESLTPDFFQDLSELENERLAVLAFDTFEKTIGSLDEWLRKLLEGGYGEVATNIVLVIAGREKLSQMWSEYSELTRVVSLGVLSESDARTLLHAQGVSELNTIDAILRLSGRIPLWLATLGAQGSDVSGELLDPSDKAIERFLKWVPEEDKRRAAISCALPSWLDADIVGVLVAKDDAQKLFGWLKAQPFVRKRAGLGWAYHDLVRQMMLRYLRNESHSEWTRLHAILSVHFEEKRAATNLTASEKYDSEVWLDLDSSYLYHFLCAKEAGGLVAVAERLLEAIPREPEYLKRVAKVVTDVSELVGGAVAEWSELLSRVAIGFTGQSSPELLDLLRRIENVLPAESSALAVIALERVRLYENGQQYEAALAELNRAIARFPKRVQLLSAKAEILERLNRSGEALSVHQRVVELEPNSTDAVVTYCGALKRGGREKEGLSVIDDALSSNPDSSTLLTERARFREQLGEFHGALEDLRRVTELYPNSVWNWYEYGALLRRQRRFGEALSAYDTALQLTQSELVASWQGDLLFHLCRFEEAAASFTKAIELRDKRKSSASTGRFKIGDRVRYVGPMDFEGRLGRALQELGRNSEALEQYRIAASRDNDQEKALYSALAADLLAELGEEREVGEYRERSINGFTALINFGDSDAAAHYVGRGEQLCALGRFDDASKDFAAAVQISPEDPHGWLSKSNALAEQGEFPAAILDFRKAYALCEERNELWEKHLLRLLLSDRRYEEAQAEYSRASNLYPDDWELCTQGALVMNKHGDAEAASKLVEEARGKCLIALDSPSTGEAHFCLALLDIATGKVRDAEVALHKAIEANPRIRSRFARDPVLSEVREHPLFHRFFQPERPKKEVRP